MIPSYLSLEEMIYGFCDSKEMSGKTCKLCGKVHSENVGSHIFTESLIRSAFNNDGKKSRGDNEIIVEISLNKIDFDYFGANVL